MVTYNIIACHVNGHSQYPNVLIKKDTLNISEYIIQPFTQFNVIDIFAEGTCSDENMIPYMGY